MIKRLFHIANLLLITLAVYAGVQVFYQFVENRLDNVSLAQVPVEVSVKPAETPEVRAPTGHYDVIARRDLFRTTQKVAPQKPAPRIDIAKIDKTAMNLKLWGTVATEDQRSGMARAVIENGKTRQQNLYKVGDAIEQASIAEIRRNYVILDVDGRKEKLVIEEKLPSQEGRITTGRDLPAAMPVEDADHRISLERTDVTDAFNNLTQLMSEVKIRPYFQDGKPAGFVVSNIAPDSVVREMGIKSGDIVNSINGQEIKSVDDAMAFYEQLRSGEKLTIEITRRGRPQTIEYTIEDDALGGR